MALMLAVMVLAMVTVQAFALLSMSTSELLTARNHMHGTQAFYLADGGLAIAVEGIRRGGEGALVPPEGIVIAATEIECAPVDALTDEELEAGFLNVVCHQVVSRATERAVAARVRRITVEDPEAPAKVSMAAWREVRE